MQPRQKRNASAKKRDDQLSNPNAGVVGTTIGPDINVLNGKMISWAESGVCISIVFACNLVTQLSVPIPLTSLTKICMEDY
jgi:hypothetical protein